MSNRRAPDMGEGESAPLARGVLRHMGVVFTAAAVFATAFTAWTPASLSPGEFVEQLLEAASARPAASPTSTTRRVAKVSFRE